MLDCRVEGVNIFNPIEGKLDKIIDYFVKFYGEKYRERITQRLTHSTFLFLGSVSKYGNDSTENKVKSYYEEKENKLYSDFFSKLGFKSASSLKFIDIDKLIKDVDSKHITGLEAKFYLDMLSHKNLIEIPKNLSYGDYNKFFSKIIDKKLSELLKKELYSIKNLWENNYKNEYELIINEKNNALTFFNKIEEKMKNSVSQIESKLDNLIIENILKFFNKDFNELSVSDKPYFIQIVKDLVEKKGKFYTDYSKRNCLELFNYLGIEGNSFDECMNNPTLQKFLKNERFLSWYKEYNSQIQKAVEENCGYFTEAVDYLNGLPLIPKVDSYSIILKQFIIGNNATLGCVFHLMDKNGNLNCLCLLNQYLNLDMGTLVHEFNHIVESDKISDKENNFIGYKCGFKDSTKDDIVNQFNGYHLFDEVVNDYISLKIYKLMKDDGFKLGYEECKKSEYSKAFPLLKDFLEENLQDIIACRMSEDPKAFIKKIGEKNFKLLINALNGYQMLGDRGEIAKYYEELKNYNGDLDNPEERKNLSKEANVLYDSIFLVDYVRKEIKNKKIKEAGIEQSS